MRTSSTRSRAPAACSARLVDPAVVELRERLGERLARDATLGLVLAAAADAVVLLGDVDELEEERERPQHGGLPLVLERGDRLAELVARASGAGIAGESANPLLVVEQLLALLLDEHAPEQVAEQAHVGAEGGVGGHALTLEKCEVEPSGLEPLRSARSQRVPRAVPFGDRRDQESQQWDSDLRKMEPRGLEPLTFWLPARRSPS